MKYIFTFRTAWLLLGLVVGWQVIGIASYAYFATEPACSANSARWCVAKTDAVIMSRESDTVFMDPPEGVSGWRHFNDTLELKTADGRTVVFVANPTSYPSFSENATIQLDEWNGTPFRVTNAAGEQTLAEAWRPGWYATSIALLCLTDMFLLCLIRARQLQRRNATGGTWYALGVFAGGVLHVPALLVLSMYFFDVQRMWWTLLF